MKKILLAFDGTRFSDGAFNFARRMNAREPILLTGVFLPQVEYANLWSYGASAGSVFIPLVRTEASGKVQENVERFERLCRRHNINHKVHKDLFNVAISGLKKETRYADLLILGSESFYENSEAGEPNECLKDALRTAECPVLVVPEKFVSPESNIMAFDGSESSVYAIKQFAYLFPELCTNKTLLVYAREGKSMPDEECIQELAASHFSDLTLLKLEVTSKKYFASWIGAEKNAILVSGSFGRSYFSQLFKKSFITDVIYDHKLPLFITHR